MVPCRCGIYIHFDQSNGCLLQLHTTDQQCRCYIMNHCSFARNKSQAHDQPGVSSHLRGPRIVRQKLEGQTKNMLRKGKPVQQFYVVQPCSCANITLTGRVVWSPSRAAGLHWKGNQALGIPRKSCNGAGFTMLHAGIPTRIVLVRVLCSQQSPTESIKNAGET